MMKCHEIFARCSSPLGQEIFQYLSDQEKVVYKAVIQNLASQRKLRPVFIERKPRLERHRWLQQALARKPAEDLAAQVLQIWLLGAHREVICAFLDGLGVAHDGKGIVENSPVEPGKEKVHEVIAHLLANHRPEVVSIYLRVFQLLDESGWNSVAEALATDPRLALPAGETSARSSDSPA